MPEDSKRTAELARQLEIATPEQIQECMAVAEAFSAAGSPKSLLDVMIERKLISAEQVAILRKALANGEKTRVIGGYEIIEKLGEGGMGAVVKARHIALDRIVALKLLSPRLTSDLNYLARFRREAKIAARLNHTNIVHCYDVGEASGCHYIAMEFVPGESLGARLRREGRIPEAETIGIGIQMAKALQEAHDNGLIHRDVKPDNILYVASNRKGELGAVCGTAKLADLGLAKFQHDEDTRLTQSGAALGTPHYVAPEQARGDADIDIRADIYSLGATLYHAMTGAPPYSGTTAAAIMAKHITEPVPDPKRAFPAISDRTAMVIRKAMAKNRNERYQTPEEMATALASSLARLVGGSTGKFRKIEVREEEEAAEAAPPPEPPAAGAGKFPAIAWPVPGTGKGDSSTPPTVIVARSDVVAGTAGRTGGISSRVEAKPAAKPATSTGSGILRPGAGDPGGKRPADTDIFPPPAAIPRPSSTKYGVPLPGAGAAAPDLPSPPGGGVCPVPRTPPPLRPARLQDSRTPPPAKTASDSAVRARSAATGRAAAGTAAVGSPGDAAGVVPERGKLPAGRRLPVAVLGIAAAIAAIAVATYLAAPAWYSGGNGLPPAATPKMAASLPDGGGRPEKPVAATGGKEQGIPKGYLTIRPRLDRLVRADSLAFSPDGRLLAVGLGDGTIRLLDTIRAAPARTLKGSHGRTWSVAFSPDGTMLAAGGEDGTVRIWLVADGSMLLATRPAPGPVRCVAFSRDGRKLADAGWYGGIRLWTVPAGGELGTLEGTDGFLEALAFSPDGKLLAAGGGGRAVGAWSLADLPARARPAPAFSVSGFDGPIVSLAFSPDGKLLAAAGGSSVRIWNATDGSGARDLKGLKAGASFCAFSPRWDILLARGTDGAVLAWDSRTGAELPLSNLDPSPALWMAACRSDACFAGALATIAAGEVRISGARTGGPPVVFAAFPGESFACWDAGGGFAADERADDNLNVMLGGARVPAREVGNGAGKVRESLAALLQHPAPK
ncbi:MAG: protein kinase [Planctomycetota bacterium]|nr:protein kinase [Planctomycetota bacterium]